MMETERNRFLVARNVKPAFSLIPANRRFQVVLVGIIIYHGDPGTGGTIHQIRFPSDLDTVDVYPLVGFCY
jgi:hypothetical protein